ncbi:uncharacterized protein DS421_20g707490 [Arachis hypogaea]|nr:uncharacterized protein DS421_20g707490 [Arachis hypogaea]
MSKRTGPKSSVTRLSPVTHPGAIPLTSVNPILGTTTSNRGRPCTIPALRPMLIIVIVLRVRCSGMNRSTPSTSARMMSSSTSSGAGLVASLHSTLKPTPVTLATTCAHASSPINPPPIRHVVRPIHLRYLPSSPL